MKPRFPWIAVVVSATVALIAGCSTINPSSKSVDDGGYVPWWVSSGTPNSVGVIVTE